MTEGGDVAPRLRWRCRRGMRELDVLLTGYLATGYSGASSADKAAFEKLLELPDPELMGFFLGRAKPVDADQARVIQTIVNAH